jgi:hypothetical protein
MHFTDGTIGWGMVVRNHESMASLAATKKDMVRKKPTMVEALGLRWYLQSSKGKR